jgi:hypothetical protein
MSLTLKSHISSNDNCGTSQFKLEHLQAPVTHIRFVAYKNPDNLPGDNGELPTNHWAAFIATSDTTFICVDVVPNEPGKPSMVVLESGKYGITYDSVLTISANVPAGLTVERLLAVIVDNKRDNYTFAPIGEGCRYWWSVQRLF